MRVLVTNDDGVHRVGLRIVTAALRDAGHDVRVVAPTTERSGSSASLGVIRESSGFSLEPVDLPGLTEVPAHAVDGPPALAVHAVCSGALEWLPDLVVAGVNPGLNTGRMVLHSGTVGAALTAVGHDIAGLAVSTTDDQPAHHRTSSVLTTWLVAILEEEQRPLAVSLNVPAAPDVHELSDIVPTVPSRRALVSIAVTRRRGLLEVRRAAGEPPFDDGTDAHALAAGSASLSVLGAPWQQTQDDTAARLADRLRERWIRDGRAHAHTDR